MDRPIFGGGGGGVGGEVGVGEEPKKEKQGRSLV